MSLLPFVAAIVAAFAQSQVHQRPWVSVSGFLVALTCSAFAVRVADDAMVVRRTESTGVFSPALFSVQLGMISCLFAAVFVHINGSARTANRFWLAGLGALALGAAVAQVFEYRKRRQSSHQVARLTTAGLFPLFGLVLLAAVVFGWDLSNLPMEVHGDEAEVGNDAIRLLVARPLLLFRAGWFALPMLHAAPTAIGLELFGTTLFGLRATSAILGVLTVLCTYFLVKRFWGPGHAFLSAFILIACRFFIHLSRSGYHYIDTPLFAVLVLCLFARIWFDRSYSAAVWCGIALGLGVQTYYASRLVPPLLVFTWAIWMVSDRREIRFQAARFLLVVLVAAMVAAPMTVYFFHHPHELWERTSDTSIFSERSIAHFAASYETDRILDILAVQMKAAFVLFHASHDSSIQYGYAGPLLDSLSGIFFVLGLGALIGRLARPREATILLWFLFPVVFGVAFTIDAPFYPRMSGAMPFVAIIVAHGLRTLLGAIHVSDGNSVRLAVRTAVCTLVLSGIFLENVRTYFFEYAASYRHSPWPEMAEFIRKHGERRVTYLVGGAPETSLSHGAIQFLAKGFPTEDIEDANDLQTRQFDPEHSLFVIMARARNLISTVEAAVGAKLDLEYIAPVGTDSAFYGAIPRTPEISRPPGGKVR